MTQFQLISLVLFSVVVAGAYKDELLKLLRGLKPVLPAPAKPSTPSPETASFVQDMLTVADLRERLADAGCQDGVEACTVLLRVMIEYK